MVLIFFFFIVEQWVLRNPWCLILDFFSPQLCPTSSCADMEKAGKVETGLAIYKLHTTEGERTRVLAYLQGRPFHHKTSQEVKGSDSRHKSVQSLSRLQLFATPWTTARQAFRSITNSWSPLKLMSIESVMPTISSSVIAFTSCLQSFPASGSFSMSQLLLYTNSWNPPNNPVRLIVLMVAITQMNKSRPREVKWLVEDPTASHQCSCYLNLGCLALEPMLSESPSCKTQCIL